MVPPGATLANIEAVAAALVQDGIDETPAWPFSSYSPLREQPCVLSCDASMEELRAAHLVALRRGGPALAAAHASSVAAAAASALRSRDALRRLNGQNLVTLCRAAQARQPIRAELPPLDVDFGSSQPWLQQPQPQQPIQQQQPQQPMQLQQQQQQTMSAASNSGWPALSTFPSTAPFQPIAPQPFQPVTQPAVQPVPPLQQTAGSVVVVMAVSTDGVSAWQASEFVLGKIPESLPPRSHVT